VTKCLQSFVKELTPFSLDFFAFFSMVPLLAKKKMVPLPEAAIGKEKVQKPKN